jgi:ABC-2 type transport system permease protein
MRKQPDVTESVRSLRMATWLGWQIESNWADPLLFAIYSIAKPMAGALILVFMYIVVAPGGLKNPLFPQIFVGNAFYIYVGSVLMGVSWAIIDDREHYGMLKYMYIAPLNIYLYVLGRGVAKTLAATVAVLITLLFGVLVLDVGIDATRVDWILLALSLMFGLAGLAFLGILLGGVSLVTARHNFYVGEAVAGALYMLCGAVFPIDVLPKYLQLLGQALPLTYWLEALRRALLGQGSSALLASFTDEALWAILAGSTLTLGVISVAFYRWAEHRAKEKGLIDMQTMY